MDTFSERLFYLLVRFAKFIGTLSAVLLAAAILYFMDVRLDYDEVLYHLAVGTVAVACAVIAYALFRKVVSTFIWLLYGDQEKGDEAHAESETLRS